MCMSVIFHHMSGDRAVGEAGSTRYVRERTKQTCSLQWQWCGALTGTAQYSPGGLAASGATADCWSKEEKTYDLGRRLDRRHDMTNEDLDERSARAGDGG